VAISPGPVPLSSRLQEPSWFRTGNLVVTAEVNAPVAGVTLRLKLENANDNTQTLETNATETTVTGWHKYTFDLAQQASGTAAFDATKKYDTASMFFDFIGATGAVSTSGQDFYMDNVTFPGEVTPAVGVDLKKWANTL
jgi:hypothetical protein